MQTLVEVGDIGAASEQRAHHYDCPCDACANCGPVLELPREQPEFVPVREVSLLGLVVWGGLVVFWVRVGVAIWRSVR